MVHISPILNIISASFTRSGDSPAISWSTTSAPFSLDLLRAQSVKFSSLSSPPSIASLPVTNSKSTTPKLYTSTFSFTLLKVVYSGAMYPNDPASTDTLSGSPLLSKIFARPKSAILALNFGSRRDATEEFHDIVMEDGAEDLDFGLELLFDIGIKPESVVDFFYGDCVVPVERNAVDFAAASASDEFVVGETVEDDGFVEISCLEEGELRV
ncbi:hypothetical protein M5K25_003394 [Dendrobium thyrsiflorum]|uniref:Uncharacterized protein n=1 Tax=Dendrobium thyrsiflorum TaxID=117978 RepID=A0ABD0VRC9_DENTH